MPDAPERGPVRAYLVRMERRFNHDEDSDLIEGIAIDPEGDRYGTIILREQRGEEPDTFLVLPDAGVPDVHAEASLDADHRTVSYEPVAALVFASEAAPPPRTVELGERWDAGDIAVYAFETEDDALTTLEEEATP